MSSVVDWAELSVPNIVYKLNRGARVFYSVASPIKNISVNLGV